MAEQAEETQNVLSGRQTPIPQRRPLHAIALSPTKRRRTGEEAAPSPESSEKVKPGAHRELGTCSSAFGLGKSASSSSQVVLERKALPLPKEVFSWLDSKSLVDHVAAVCREWRDVASSPELWAILRNHLRLVDQLLFMDKVAERRSKGKIFRCRRLGTGQMTLLRMVDLELTNAGKDDGVPTTFLREAALLNKLKHPNVISHFGSEIIGKKAVMCTEYVHESFTAWFKRLDSKVGRERLGEIKVNFRQLLTGLSFIHHQGVMHRNLKPDNIFLDDKGVVKIGDFTTTRMLDIPFQAYTPEDPKERDRSGREMRRLWYRPPELILRDEIYGPCVDSWSVGCLLAEAASGRHLFQADSEMDLLFRVFRLVGTPNLETWPEVVTMKNYSPHFPVYSAFNLAQVTRSIPCGGSCVEDINALDAQAQPDREDIRDNLVRVAQVLGVDGMYVLDRLVITPPSARASADETLAMTLFADDDNRSGTASHLVEARANVRRWLLERGVSDAPTAAAAAAATTPENAAEAAARSDAAVSQPPAKQARLSRGDRAATDCPPAWIPTTFIPARMVWDILQNMERAEHGSSEPTDCRVRRAGQPPRLPPALDAEKRAVLMDFVVGLATTLSLTDYTLHLAVRIVDGYLELHEEPVSADQCQVVGATCLKIADVFAEQSKEYYKQENAGEYAEATFHAATSEQMLQCEKDVLPKLGFNLHLPTAHWFAQCYLAYCRLAAHGNVSKIASFIGNLTLLDYDVLAYPPSLRAQCAVVLAVFLVQRAKSEKRKPPPPVPRPAGGTPSQTVVTPSSMASSAPAGTPAVANPAAQEAAGVAAALAGTVTPGVGSASGSSSKASEANAANDTSGGSSSSRGQEGRGLEVHASGEADGCRLSFLEHWDKHVRSWVCRGNNAVDAEMCLQALVRILVVQRREWKAQSLTNVEAKHSGLSRTLVYPEKFPISKLVQYILPDSQRSLLPE